MEPQSKRHLSEDVVEILPNDFPSSSSGWWKNSNKRAKKVVPHDVIVIDGDEDYSEVVLTNDMVIPGNKGKEKLMGNDKSWANDMVIPGNKGKEKLMGNDKSWANHVKEALAQVLTVPASAKEIQNPFKRSGLGSGNSNNFSDELLHFGSDNLSSYHDNLSHNHGALSLESQIYLEKLPPSVEAPIPWVDQSASIYNDPIASYSLFGTDQLNSSFSDGNDDVQVWMPKDVESWKKQASNNSASFVIKSCSRKENEVEEDEISKKFRLFKKFDTVSDFSDHHFTTPKSSNSKQASSWSKTIHQEWKILEKDLPDTIFVRVFEERMDLLRAVVVGAAGTPYHDGLFFFDFYFPPTYPNVPPKVHYHSGGVRLNPNLYNCGKVCLSLLNTWQGNKNEKWTPRKSTVLQVLLSIQALVLNAKPYFNEPGYERTAGTPQGEKMAENYNESTYILSCRTMLFSLKRPPMHFKDFVVGHFRECARAILVACKAYMEGAQVGCLVGGGVQDVDEGDKSSSKNFQMQVADMVKLLVPAFKEIGAKDCEQFLPKTSNTGNQATTNSGYQVLSDGYQVSYNNAYQATYNNGYQMPLNSGFPAPYNGYEVPLNSGYQGYNSGVFVNPNPITSMYKSWPNS